MKIAVAALLLTEWNVNVDHKKSSEKIQSSNLFKLNGLISKSSVVNEVIKFIT